MDALHRNVRLLQLHTLGLNMIFTLPVIVPYYRDVIGLGFYEFMVGEALFSAVVILMEIPTGWISDVWTRKKTIIAATFVNILGFTVLWQANSFAAAVAAQMILGVSVSLLSGTNSAMLYDSLLENGQENRYRKLEGFRHGLGLYTIGGSSLLGGFLYAWHPELPVILSIVTSVAALGACFAMSEPSRHREAVHKNPLADMVKTVRYALQGHEEILAIIVLSAVLFATTKILLWAQQPYYILLDLPLGWYGVLTAFGFLLGGLGGHYGHLLDGRHGNVVVLRVLLVWTFGVCLIAGLYPGLYGIGLLLSGSLIWGFGWPRVQEAINNRVGSARRATILSTASLAVHMVSIPLLALTGRLGDHAGIAAALLFMAGFLFCGGIAAAILWAMKKQRVPGEKL